MSDNAPEESRAALLVTTPPDPATQGNTLFNVVSDLSEVDYERYRAAYIALDGILVENLFTYYEESFKALAEMWRDTSKKFATGPIKIDGHSTDMVSLGARFRGAVLSLVSMLCYHQERTYEEICAKYEKDGPEHQAAKGIFGSLYDDYFGYRYLYKLRNVMIHGTIRAVSISLEAYANKGNPFAFIDLTMDRDSLIKSDKINATLKAELASKPGDPSIMQMAMEFHKALRKANRQLLTILHPDLTDVCNTVLEFDSLFEGQDGVRGLISQKSPELRAPFTTGFTPWAGDVIMFARSYTTEDWKNPDDEG
ncbi:hypothetical protein [Mycobacterium sp. UM_CSW]|uniref:hypothetical protein n=1 Tax=Mycobacterium sp. UM_CSW TaxID=1370119 RepID=UPI001267F37D|nr:hypothetical protein [Mycobacterium sp. UM_CSW]